jgi:hypothetical protein
MLVVSLEMSGHECGWSAYTSTRPILHNVRFAEDSSSVVCVARVRVDRGLGEGSRRLSVNGSREDKSADEESCGQHGVNLMSLILICFQMLLSRVEEKVQWPHGCLIYQLCFHGAVS